MVLADGCILAGEDGRLEVWMSNECARRRNHSPNFHEIVEIVEIDHRELDDMGDLAAGGERRQNWPMMCDPKGKAVGRSPKGWALKRRSSHYSKMHPICTIP